MKTVNPMIFFWNVGGRSGYYVEWYRDDDNNSGYGEDARIARWYGTKEECEERANGSPPRDSNFYAFDSNDY